MSSALSRRKLIMLGSAAALAAACQPAPTTTTRSPAATGATAPAAPRRGGSIGVDIGEGFVITDPQQLMGTYNKNFTYNYAETLIVRTPDMSLQPGLATSWTASADRATWTFKLRQGVKFHDGSPFDAEAVKVNVDRWIDPQSTSVVASTFRAAIAGARVVDSSTVEVQTKGPQTSFLGVTTAFGANLISAQQFRDGGAAAVGATAMGTGPFKIDSFTPRESLVLVRNDDYWGEKPYLDRVTIRFIAEPSARTAALLTGQTDFVFNVSPSQLAAVEAGATMVRQPALLSFWLAMNTTNPTLNNPVVRQAFNYAVNDDALKQLFSGLTEPYQGPITPLVYKSSVQSPYAFDPAKARQLLQQAGVPSGTKFRYVYASTPDADRRAQAIQEQLRQVGLEIELVKVDAAGLTAAQASGDYDLIPDGLGHSVADAGNSLFSLLHSTSTRNRSKYKNPTMDGYIDALNKEFDQTARATILDNIFRLYYQEPPWVGHYSNVIAIAMNKKLQGLKIGPTIDTNFNTMWLSE
jgi:peptide/nickel transport system substrate-binding protein